MEEQKSWFRRNWLWFVPTMGCLTLIVLGVLGLGTLFFGATKLLADATPSQYAIAQASKNENVIAILGDSIEKDGIISGNVSFKNGDSTANLSIPISGTKSSGTIKVVAIKTDGIWVYETLYVFIKSKQEKINLLPKVLEEI
jgi:hypothetical protein